MFIFIDYKDDLWSDKCSINTINLVFEKTEINNRLGHCKSKNNNKIKFGRGTAILKTVIILIIKRTM